jgi:cbb3-type cytochrome oxidase subunit 3
MFEWLQWFTKMENSKVLALIIFFVTFCLILLYVYTNKKRSKRLESYKNIPFQDDEEESNVDLKVNEDERREDK